MLLDLLRQEKLRIVLVLSRDSATRRVALGSEHESIRKNRASQQTTRSHPRSCKGARIPESPGIRQALRRALHTAVAASSSGRIILEVFAGSQRFTKAMKKLGRGVVAIDSNLGAHCDVLNTVVLQTLLGWITSGRVQGILIATPCGSQSRARRAPSWSRFPSTIRSTERPR